MFKWAWRFEHCSLLGHCGLVIPHSSLPPPRPLSDPARPRRIPLMRFLSAISTNADADSAAAEVLASLRRQDKLAADVAFVFFTAHHNSAAEQLAERLWLELDPQTMIGCCAEGVIGGELEVERQPGL